MLAKERGQRIGRDRTQREIIERHGKRAIFLQGHQHPAQPRRFDAFDQPLAQLRRLHRRGGGQRRFEIAMILDQLRCGLGADPVDARHVVDRIAHQRQHVADLFGHHAELLDHFGHVDSLVLHGVQHVDAAAARFRGALAHQLHQVLVGTDDGDVPAARGGGAGIGGDEVVGLEAAFLDAGKAEGTGGVANQRELGHEVLGRGRAVGLVFRVDIVAERVAGLVQDHRQMRRPIGLVEIIGQLPQHRGIAIDRADRRAFGICQGGQAVVGTENVGRAINQVEMLLLLHVRGASSVPRFRHAGGRGRARISDIFAILATSSSQFVAIVPTAIRMPCAFRQRLSLASVRQAD